MEHWEKIVAVQKMQDYIEANAEEPITLRKLADVAGYSPWHSARVFKEITHKAPFEYIRALRLSKAADRLSEPNKPRIVDVAFDFVFDSHEGFTRAFSKQFGMTPSYYAKHKPPIAMFIPQYAKEYYRMKQTGEVEMDKEINTVFVQAVDRPARKLILKRGVKAEHYFEYCNEVGCEVWDVLSSIKDALYEPIGMWLPDNLRLPNTSFYAQGVEVPLDYSGEIPSGYEIIELKPCKMLVFQGQPFDEAKFETAIEDLWDVMKQYDPEMYGFEWADEDGPRFQLAPLGYRGYIEARPVRPINA